MLRRHHNTLILYNGCAASVVGNFAFTVRHARLRGGLVNMSTQNGIDTIGTSTSSTDVGSDGGGVRRDEHRPGSGGDMLDAAAAARTCVRTEKLDALMRLYILARTLSPRGGRSGELGCCTGTCRRRAWVCVSLAYCAVARRTRRSCMNSYSLLYPSCKLCLFCSA